MCQTARALPVPEPTLNQSLDTVCVGRPTTVVLMTTSSALELEPQ